MHDVNVGEPVIADLERFGVLVSEINTQIKFSRRSETESACRQAGATLIEVLISLLLLSVGLLGVTGVQTLSLRYTQSAYIRTQAVIAGTDIVERIRGNRQFSSDAIAEWTTMLAVSLPAGEGLVCADSTPEDGTPNTPACDGADRLLAVKIWWDEDRDGVAEKRFSLGFSP